MKLTRTTPILRIFDPAKAREFYVDFLGFSVDWEHRFEEGTPLYLQVSRDACVLHLSEHYGDATPGAGVFIVTEGLEAWCAELNAKRYQFSRPEVEDAPWGGRVMRIPDPFGNTRINGT